MKKLTKGAQLKINGGYLYTVAESDTLTIRVFGIFKVRIYLSWVGEFLK